MGFFHPGPSRAAVKGMDSHCLTSRAMTSEAAAARALAPTVDRRCPFCGKDTALRLRAAIWSGQRLAFVGPMGPVNNKLATALYQCDICDRAIMFLFEEDSSEPRLLGAWPRMRAHANQALPPDVDADRVEAWNCFFGAEHRAATIMARSALRRAVWSLDPLRSDLEAELDNLVATGIVDDELRARLASAGLIGDAPETLGPVGEEHARAAVDALDEMLAATIAPPVR
jgi:hypothetical protein